MESTIEKMPPRKQRIKSEKKNSTKMYMLMLSSFTWMFGNVLFSLYSLKGEYLWLNIVFLISYVFMSIVLAELINKIKMPLWGKWIVNILFFAIGFYMFFK